MSIPVSWFDEHNGSVAIVWMGQEEMSYRGVGAQGLLDLAINNATKGDYVVFLDITFAGVEREYYSFIPISSPLGKSILHAYLVDTSTNLIIAQNHQSVMKHSEGKWKQAPEYESLKAAVRKALETALVEIHDGFFELYMDTAAE